MVLGDETTNNKTHRNSLKLDISDASNSVAVDNPKETYRSIPEYPLVETNNHREGDGKWIVFFRDILIVLKIFNRSKLYLLKKTLNHD